MFEIFFQISKLTMNLCIMTEKICPLFINSSSYFNLKRIWNVLDFNIDLEETNFLYT